MPRCPNGTQKNRKTGICEKSSKKSPKTISMRPKNTISKEDLDQIIHNNIISETRMKELSVYIPKLKRMRYNKKYISCFTDQPTRDLYNMIETKIQCWAKYDDPI